MSDFRDYYGEASTSARANAILHDGPVAIRFVPIKAGYPITEFETLDEAHAISDEVVKCRFGACDGSDWQLLSEEWLQAEAA